MQRLRNTIQELATAGILLLLAGIVIVAGLNISIPQKPPPTPLPTPYAFIPPTPTPVATPVPRTAGSRSYSSVTLAQQNARFKLMQPADLPDGSRLQRVEVRDSVVIQTVIMYYTLKSGATLELRQTEPNVNTYEMRYSLLQPELQDTTQVQGEQGMFQTDAAGMLSLVWVHSNQIFTLYDHSSRLTRTDLQHIADSVR